MRNFYRLILSCLMLCTTLDGQSQSSKTFTYTGAFEKYIVPTTGWYLLEAGGAQGGPSSEFSHTGGNGAFIQCNVKLMAGDTLRIAVGGMGVKGYSVLPLTSGGGGGGGSSIVKVNGSTQVPLVFAGGGGGATSDFDGMPGLPGREGGMGGALQGDGGNGGNSPFGFGGGGYSGSGVLSQTSGSQQQGLSYLSGNAGGMALSNGGKGGWGGGGAGALGAAWNNNPTGGGGGGGGYTGGAGGSVNHAAGGGGSYFRNDDNAYTHGLQQVQGGNNGNGTVTITLENDFTPPKNLFRFRGEPSYHFTVPVTGWYLLEASGAQGGLSPSNLSETGGRGAHLQGYVKLTAGEMLYVYVGGMGKGPTVGRSFPEHFPGAGGGGATYILRWSGPTLQPLLVAGGGGGWGVSGNGSPGLSASYGGAGAGDGGIGGSGGNGGTSKRNGAGGAGFLMDGGSHCNGTCDDNDWLAFGGQCFKSGNRGGYAGIKFNDGNNYAVGIQGGSGGWGGGGQGGASWDSYHGGGGGGGGYSGGGAGGSEKNDPTAGGGGSFTADEVYAYGCVALTGANWGDGLARIEYVPKLELPTRYGYKSNTFQRFVAPKTGWYLLDASGAQGGQSSTFFGGRGARIQGYTPLQAGDTLLIAVGGMGQKGVSNGNLLSGGGGGGSTSIVKVNGPTRVPLLVVGGGGGAASRQNGYLGLKTLNGGTAAKCGGSEGWGGCIGDNKRGGGGGAGYKGDGGTHCDGICNGSNVLSYGGQAYLSGNSGGATSNYGGDGGWGGGGEGGVYTFLGDGGGGGGGGWSGGGGADPGYGGGGGGSYVAPELDTLGCLSLSGANDGDGGVSVKYLSNYLGTNTITFVHRGKIFQYFKVPKDGFYQLEARGAQGGICYGIQGGLGATLKGYVFLKAGDSLQIAAGGSGGMAGLNLYDHSAAGGGGATSIVKLNPPSSGQRFTPLFIAAGGGGASRENPGGDGQANQSGFEPRSSIGKGGLVNYDNSRFRYGGAGGGFYQAGDTSYSDLLNKAIALPGQSYLSGNAGGGGIPNNSPDKSDKYGPEGGWGGGGQGGAEKLYGHQYMSWSSHSGGGGGGGYTGGSVFGNKNRSSYGGGSFVSPSFVMTGLTLLAGDNLSDGVAIIAGPRTATDTVRSPGTYTWPRNGVSYRSSGLYVWVDSLNAITRTLDLRITSLLGRGPSGPAGGSLMAFPNPSNGLLTLRTPSLEVAAKLEIYSVDGRIVQEYEVPSRTTRFKVDLRRHGAGVYMFRMVAEGEDEHIKVIVE